MSRPSSKGKSRIGKPTRVRIPGDVRLWFYVETVAIEQGMAGEDQI